MAEEKRKHGLPSGGYCGMGRQDRWAARELGINAGILARRRTEMREAAQGEVKAFPRNGNARDEELVRLKKRAAELEEANEIQKRMCRNVIFAKAA